MKKIEFETENGDKADGNKAMKIFIIKFRKEEVKLREKYSWVLDVLSGAERHRQKSATEVFTIRMAFKPE